MPESFVRDYLQPLPPPDEQSAIAAFLDRETAQIDALIAKQERLIALLQEKRQALISHAVTKGLDPAAPLKQSGVEWLGEVPAHWSVVPLGYLAEKIGSGKTPLGGADVYVPDGVLFLRSQNVYDDGLRLDDVAYIPENVDEAMASTRVLPGDILLNITGASLGRTCIVPDGLGSANVNQHVCIIRLRDRATGPYVSWLLKSAFIKDRINQSQNGAAREGLTFSEIAKLPIALPASRAEIEFIVNYLQGSVVAVDSLVEKCCRTISLLQERRAALIAAAVTGQIDVRGA